METITVDQIINSLKENFALIDFNGRIIDANDLLAKLLGVKRKQLIGEYAVNFWSKHALNQIKEGIEQTKKKGHLEGLVGALISKKGKEIPVVFNTSLMKNAKDMPYAVLVIVKDLRKTRKRVDKLKSIRNLLKDRILKKKQDIIETNHDLSETNKQLKSSEESLRILFKQIKETQLLKSIYLTGLSEEFYNPTLSILGFIEVLKERVCRTAQSEKEFLKDIKNHTNYLLEILGSLDDLLKIEKGNIELKPQRADLFVIYSNLKNMYQNILEFNKNIELEFAFPYEPLPDVYIDKSKLKLIMINLINTAIAYIGRGKIVVKTTPHLKEGFVLTQIESAPHDMADDVLFERFSELFKNKDKISGLALEKTKKIIEDMGGSFSFESYDEGRVVAGKITLPIFNHKRKY